MSGRNTAERIKKSLQKRQEDTNELARRQIVEKKIEDLERRVSFQDQKIRLLEEELAFAQNKVNENTNRLDGAKSEQEESLEQIWKILDDIVRPKLNNCMEYRHKTREALLIIAKRLDEIDTGKNATE